MNRVLSHTWSKIRKKLKMGHSLSELEPDLIAEELLFRAPPLSPNLLAAIRLIAPQFHLRADEGSRRFWELNQNGACWGEYRAFEPFLERVGIPKRILDIGPGLGRSVIFMGKLDGWQGSHFDLYEGSGSSTKYTKAGPRFEDSFCGNLEALRTLLDYNEVQGQTAIFDASRMGGKLAGLAGPYDLIYSFFAVGFHWSIEHFLDEILDLMHDRSIGVFTLHDRFTNLSALDSVPHQIIRSTNSWPRGKSSRLLILAKAPGILESATSS